MADVRSTFLVGYYMVCQKYENGETGNRVTSGVSWALFLRATFRPYFPNTSNEIEICERSTHFGPYLSDTP